MFSTHGSGNLRCSDDTRPSHGRRPSPTCELACRRRLKRVCTGRRSDCAPHLFFNHMVLVNYVRLRWMRSRLCNPSLQQPLYAVTHNDGLPMTSFESNLNVNIPAFTPQLAPTQGTSYQLEPLGEQAWLGLGRPPECLVSSKPWVPDSLLSPCGEHLGTSRQKMRAK